MAASFHPRAGRLVSLSNGGRTARRLRAAHEFNHGLVMSREPLRDGQLFQIRIDRKLNSWSGSLEVGLTSRDPGQEASELPSSATTLRGGAWLLSGSCVLHDAKTLLDAYGRTHADECVDLDSLEEGALVGVQRTAAGEFHVWLNGHDCGVAATGLPSPVWALIDLYGKCTQVTVVDDERPQQAADHPPEASPCLPSAAPPPDNVSASRTESRRSGAARHSTRAASTSSLAAVAVDAGLTVAVDVHGSAPLGFALASSSSASLLSAPAHSWSSPPTPHAPVSACNDALLFHAKCGALIRLSNNQKTAERRRPLDEFNNGVVLTNRPLRHGETFEIRIDRLVDKWSGSLEIGVTTHDPNSMDYPATMTNMMSGTIMMSGCGILTNGKGTRREYCDFSLDELQEGDHIGLIRKTNGELHFYVNGLDQGVAASQTATTIYGVVDLYGMAAKVTIVHEQNHADRLRRNTAIMRAISPESTNRRARATAGGAGHSSGLATGRLNSRSEADTCGTARATAAPMPLLAGENFDESVDFCGDLETRRGAERTTRAVRERERVMDEVGWRDEEQETERETPEVAEGEKSAEDDMNSSRERRREQISGGDASGLFERYEDIQSRRCRNGEVGGGRQSLADRETNRDNYLRSDLDYFSSLSSYTDFGIAYCRAHATRENLLRSARSRELQVERELNREEEMDTGRQVEIESDRGRLLPELNLPTNLSDARHLIAHTNVRLAASWRERGGNGDEDLENGRERDDIGLGLSHSSFFTNARLSTWRERETERERDRGTAVNRSICTPEPNQLSLPTAEAIFANSEFSGLDNGSDVELNGQSCNATALAGGPSVGGCGSGEMEASVTTVIEGGEGTPGDCGPLLFHPNCGQRAAVVNGGRTALRPNALEDFNHGVVLSNRPLRPGERFEVRIDRMVDKWAGSIEVGVTTHSPVRIALPSTMTNMRSGTWMMTGNGVMHNGTTILDDYGHNLDRLRAGDSVGVIRHVDGALHLLVNGEDQGRAVIGVPPCVYAVLDLYGQAAQATILDSTHDMPPLPDDLSDTHTHPTPCTPPLSLCDCGNGPARCDLVFAHFHGTNAVITNGGRTALRQNPRAEFNDAIVITNRPLRDGELFEIVIEKMVDRWSGSIEVGVTAILPEELHFPNTMTDIDHDTWMLSGTAIMRDGNTVCNSYGSDLDRLGFGSRIGMLRSRHGALHYFINGVDQGPAATGLPAEVYAVVDLYGQCAQVSVTASSGVVDNSLSSSVVTHLSLPEDSPRLLGVAHRLHACCGKGIVLRREGRSALRLHGYAHGLLFSAAELRTGELFEVQVDDVNDLWAGTLHAGLTSLSTSDPARLAPSALQLRSKFTWLVVGSEVRCNGVTQRQNYGATLDRLRVGNRVGVKRCHDDTMHLVIDGKDMGPAATGVPAGVHAVFDLYGTVTSVTVTSTGCALVCASPEKIPGTVSALQPTLPELACSAWESPVFVDGRNLLLSNHNRTATRRDGCSQAVARTAHVLPRQCLLQVCVDRLSHEWSGSLCLGMESVSEGHSPTAHTPTARTPLARSPATPPSSIVQGGRQQSWLIRGRAVYHNSTKIRDGYGPGLDSLAEGTRVGLLVDALGALHLYVNGVDQGACAAHVPVNTRVAVHLYGCCLKVTLVTDEGACGEEGCEDREKADMVDGLKEGVLRPPACVDGSVLRAVCDYQAVCVRFRDLLALPGGFFTPCVSCFCTSCCHLRDDEAYRTRGEPPRDYSLPLGWVHFTLRTNPRSDATFLKRWHVAYHGASIGDVRRSLDHGELYAASKCPLFAQKMKADESGAHTATEGQAAGQGDVVTGLLTAAVRLSPSLPHASRDCSYITFRDPKTQSMHGAQVAFQVCVRPGAYKYSAHPAVNTGHAAHPFQPARSAHALTNTYPPHTQSAATHSNIHAPDTRFPSSEIEWFTKERGSTIITALLIRVE
ncbi:LOW QUALITY PROTEIN: neuralized-like protein 4 [Lethenteron reissneri]|uniref:LOW QUALITY PROTEIN: neuralized-like protein 4 n=1 Tax=Lethenteron reissneri TaxID=7753 RepID=UPI002AB7D45C|nr:LOW QUALITY PROTEIN: neuralized-like protein 4 [Lethenteron reissneri]